MRIALAMSAILLCACLGFAEDDTKRVSVSFSGEVDANEDFIRACGDRFAFVLKPTDHGWRVQIRDERGTEDISKYTTPWYGGKTPTLIDGWHFRNEDNSGPNKPGPNNVNAPQEIRRFIFSPEVGRTIGASEADGKPTPDQMKRIRAFGAGELRIRSYRLSNLNEGQRTRFKSMKFDVKLSWPKGGARQK